MEIGTYVLRVTVFLAIVLGANELLSILLRALSVGTKSKECFLMMKPRDVLQDYIVPTFLSASHEFSVR